MYLGRVVGSIWSTMKDSRLDGHRLLLVQPLSSALEPTGKRLVCADCTGAGAGELIYWSRGKEASFAFLPNEVPVDATIVAIVDKVNVRKK
ncbi:MAG: EutN/CcmL family microcompartment protein [Bryobacteraceae bacterium]